MEGFRDGWRLDKKRQGSGISGERPVCPQVSRFLGEYSPHSYEIRSNNMMFGEFFICVARSALDFCI